MIYKICRMKDGLEIARSVCDFILRDLPRTVENDEEICFSYAPNSDTRIFNASLLAAEVLASVGGTPAKLNSEVSQTCGPLCSQQPAV